MLGAIIGDMVGSIYDFKPIKTKDFKIYDYNMRMTDDSLLTIAVAKVIMNNYPIIYKKKNLEIIKEELRYEFVKTWESNKGAGFGAMFYLWCQKAKYKKVEPYNSLGNGCAMRISPIGWIANTEKHLKILSKAVTEITHNHPDSIKGAEAISLCIYLSLHNYSKEEIRKRMIEEYYPEIQNFIFWDLVKNYEFSEICSKSVPQAIYCFLISNSLEDAIRNCIAIGGDCDTTAAMAGAIAEAYYQKDKLSAFEDKFLYFLIDKEVEDLIKKFHKTIGSNKFINI